MTLSLTEILVLIAGLTVGYWIVSKVIDNFDCDDGHPLGEHVAAPAAAGADADAPWHEVLNVPPDASAEQIRQAHRLLMQQYHPDRVATLSADLKLLAERKSGEIERAFERAMRDR